MGSIAEPTHPAELDYKGWPNEAGFNATEIHGDTQTPIRLQLNGHFPDYAAGTLYRTGPGAYKVSRSSDGKRPGNGKSSHYSVSHWFDGFTTTHKFDLVAGHDGKCSEIRYSSRQQVDELVETARETGRLDGISFGQKRDPCDTLFKKFKSVFTPTMDLNPRTSNVGVAVRAPLPVEIALVDPRDREGRKLIALTTDTCQSKVFDAETLEPLGVADQTKIDPALTGPVSAAHASHDPRTGEIFNYNISFGQTTSYKIWRASPSGETEILATIRGSSVRGAYLHSLLLTPNFVILCVWPAYFQAKGAKILWERNLLDAMKFDADSEATWYIIDRHHGRGVVKQFRSPSFFCFHTTNAWEESGEKQGSVDITCKLVEHQNTDILHQFYYENMVSTSPQARASKENYIKNARVRLVRHRLSGIPLLSKTSQTAPATNSQNTTDKILSIEAGDLPRFNEDYTFRPHRYVYTVLDRGHSSFLDGLGKTDTLTGETVVWEKARHTPGEPIFVPAPGEGNDEDDGVLLCVVFDGDLGSSYLLCLDAKTFKEIGRAEVGKAVGFGFHGSHLPAASTLA